MHQPQMSGSWTPVNGQACQPSQPSSLHFRMTFPCVKGHKGIHASQYRRHAPLFQEEVHEGGCALISCSVKCSDDLDQKKGQLTEVLRTIKVRQRTCAGASGCVRTPAAPDFPWLSHRALALHLLAAVDSSWECLVSGRTRAN